MCCPKVPDFGKKYYTCVVGISNCLQEFCCCNYFFYKPNRKLQPKSIITFKIRQGMIKVLEVFLKTFSGQELDIDFSKICKFKSDEKL